MFTFSIDDDGDAVKVSYLDPCYFSPM